MREDSISINPIALTDVEDLYRLMTSNAARFLRFFPNTLKQNMSIEESNIFIHNKRREEQAKEEYTYTIKEHSLNKLLGLLILKEINWETKQGELAYCIDQNFEGKGITTHAVQYMSNYAFRKLGLRTLQIFVHKSNLGSIRVAEKCNYIWQRTMIEAFTPPYEEALDMELYELKK